MKINLFVDDFSSIADEFEKANKHIYSQNMHLALKAFVLMSLHWAYAVDQGLIPDVHLPDPYEPILIFYERGGYVRKYGGLAYFFITDGEKEYRVKEGYWPEGKESPLLSLDKGYLDQLDEEPLPEQD